MIRSFFVLALFVTLTGTVSPPSQHPAPGRNRLLPR